VKTALMMVETTVFFSMTMILAACRCSLFMVDVDCFVLHEVVNFYGTVVDNCCKILGRWPNVAVGLMCNKWLFTDFIPTVITDVHTGMGG